MNKLFLLLLLLISVNFSVFNIFLDPEFINAVLGLFIFFFIFNVLNETLRNNLINTNVKLIFSFEIYFSSLFVLNRILVNNLSLPFVDFNLIFLNSINSMPGIFKNVQLLVTYFCFSELSSCVFLSLTQKWSIQHRLLSKSIYSFLVISNSALKYLYLSSNFRISALANTSFNSFNTP
jgi:hypothetical protein